MARQNSKVLAVVLVILAILPGLAAAQGGSCIDLVPNLTSNSSAVSSSGNFSSTYPAWKVFDGEVTGMSMWISETFETPAWVAYDFGEPVVIERYQITNSNGPSLTSRAPKDFTLQGWDGKNWNVVDTQTDETDWISGSPRLYKVAYAGAYSAYRLHITDDNDSRAGIVVISMSDLELAGCVLFSDGFESSGIEAWSSQSP